MVASRMEREAREDPKEAIRFSFIDKTDLSDMRNWVDSTPDRDYWRTL